ncbi:hypothetical protein M422DRAFT_211323 [Sphaerobolus stellatus SS14]|uniref:ABC transporter domain-containing protein n=1 Tax=Sphaerobolus stellatus (strain SS14) TaxID=990650 RepID=A0A0C9URX3_SPHS4|nr:hypothetical protein M422DRAFT_211323 [Sphaerobolus stellatus SS14]
MNPQADLQEPLLSTRDLGDDIRTKATEPPVRLKFRTIGIWTIMTQVPASHSQWTLPGRSILEEYKKLRQTLPTVYRFLKECYNTAPHMMVGHVICGIWQSTQDSVALYLSSRILNILQAGITTGNIDGPALIRAIAFRVLFTLGSSVMEKFRLSAIETLSTRIGYLFKERAIKASLWLDLPTYEEPEVSEKLDAALNGRGYRSPAWTMLDTILGKVGQYAGIFSKLGTMHGILRSQRGGMLFAPMFLVKAVIDLYDEESLWETTAYMWASNPHYGRMSSLVGLVEKARHRMEIISDGLSNYIHGEWVKARRLLGDTSDDTPDMLLDNQRSLPRVFISSLIEDVPLLFYSIQVYFDPMSFSLSTLALIQQGSQLLTSNIYWIFKGRDSMLQTFHQINELYAIENIENKLLDGNLNYPEDVPESRGMGITFENVSFSYPRTTITSPEVIKDVSFNIKPGQVVVIVGINGSGKSTLLKLFNRLYDPTSGTIYVDGIPITSFVAADVRRSAAMLFQTYSHYPLSIGENIALGRPEIAGLLRLDEEIDNEDEKALLKKTVVIEGVKEAARMGGSLDLIHQQKSGFESVLQSSTDGWCTTSENLSQGFKDKMAEVKNATDLSAGQWQRLALSRLFFRAQSDLVKLVAADEPSASLDPMMEYELFERLRNLSTMQGKTMIYVTHRFGYLTKHADLILVMQEGELVEQGKHADLVGLDGEYAKLYRLQAEAFTPAANETKNE